MCLNIGIPKTIKFPFGTNTKLMVLVVQMGVVGWCDGAG